MPMSTIFVRSATCIITIEMSIKTFFDLIGLYDFAVFSSTTDEYKRQHNVNSSKLDMNTRNGLNVKIIGHEHSLEKKI